MNKAIIDNLYEFWTFIGKKNKRLVEHSNYKSISNPNADWLNRVFDISIKNSAYTIIQELRNKGEIPCIINFPETNETNGSVIGELLYSQRNMALNLATIKTDWKDDENIKLVETDEEAEKFALTASEAFDYIVDTETISLIYNETSKLRLFNYIKNKKSIACGIVFFDSHFNAGFHMIGTIPKERGKGIGTLMTRKLISEAIIRNSKNCVLQASNMGEGIYKNLGFIPFGKINTYRIK